MSAHNTSWNKVADWYDEYLKGDDIYQKAVILPNLLRLLAPLRGKRVLDIGCGQGFFSREFARAGATVFGVDASSALIERARKTSERRITYHVARAEDMKIIKSESVDAAIMILALQNMERPLEALKECARALVKGSSLFLVLNHPAFRIPKYSDWGFDEDKKVQYRRVNLYLTETKEVIDMMPSHPGTVETVSFHRPLQVYTKNLANAGFLIRRMEEWASHKKSEPGPRKKYEDKARQEFPLFLMIEAVKL